MEARYLAAKADVKPRPAESLNLAIEGPRKQDIAAARAKLEALKAARAWPSGS